MLLNLYYFRHCDCEHPIISKIIMKGKFLSLTKSALIKSYIC